MRKSIKAVLFSALIYPGAGHVLLKKYFVGGALILTASVAVYIVLANAVAQASMITDKILNGEIAPDILSISTAAANLQTPEQARTVSIATAVVVLAWVIGIVDAYRVGRTADKDLQQNL